MVNALALKSFLYENVTANVANVLRAVYRIDPYRSLSLLARPVRVCSNYTTTRISQIKYPRTPYPCARNRKCAKTRKCHTLPTVVEVPSKAPSQTLLARLAMPRRICKYSWWLQG